MSLGTIMYYILWPLVAVALVVYWIFLAAMFLIELGVECIQNFHEEIKEF